MHFCSFLMLPFMLHLSPVISNSMFSQGNIAIVSHSVFCQRKMCVSLGCHLKTIPSVTHSIFCSPNAPNESRRNFSTSFGSFSFPSEVSSLHFLCGHKKWPQLSSLLAAVKRFVIQVCWWFFVRFFHHFLIFPLRQQICRGQAAKVGKPFSMQHFFVFSVVSSRYK